MASPHSAGRVLREILSREVRELGASFRFRVTAALTLSLMLLSAVTGGLRYREETREFQRQSDKRAAAIAGMPLPDLLNTKVPISKPPWKLAPLSDGRQQWAPGLYRATLNVWRIPELSRHRDAKPGLGAREPLDWVFVIRVVLSMAAFVLGYDAMCGAKQRAALRMLLSYPVLRGQAVAAKLLAVWACVAAPFVLGALAGLPVQAALGGARFSTTELAKVGVLLGIALWAAGFFSAVAVWVSIRVRESARSLALLALLWVTAVVVVPGAGGLLAQTVRPLPTDREVAREIEEIATEVEEAHGGPGSFRGSVDNPSDYLPMHRTAVIHNDRFRLQEQARRRRIRDELAQVELAHRLASASPMFLVQDLAERLIGTGIVRDRSFVEQAWGFADLLAARARQLDAMDPDSPRLWSDVGPWGAEGIYVRLLPIHVSGRIVGPEDLPRFVFRERSLRQGLRAAAPRILLFGLFTGVLLALLRASSKGFDAGAPG
jgi:hypothetical protein